MIPNGVNLKRFHPAVDLNQRKALRSAFGLGDHHRMITMIGAVHPRKGSDLLLDAWVQLAKRFPEAHLFVVGARKDLIDPNLIDFRKKINALLAASGAADRVHFTGFIENAVDYLQASDVFVFPSLREGMPNAVIEAMACGLPVILTPFKGLSDDFGVPEKEYILAEHDGRSLSHAITKVLQHRELGLDLGLCARKWIERKMDLERVLDRYADLYHKLADHARQ
jgi:glycosyltransferase involved in cell wall biosynthesis